MFYKTFSWIGMQRIKYRKNRVDIENCVPIKWEGKHLIYHLHINEFMINICRKIHFKLKSDIYKHFIN